jgi:hypothetical protein
VYDGTIFQRPLAIELGEVVCRDGRYYIDVLPAGTASLAAVTADAIPPI